MYHDDFGPFTEERSRIRLVFMLSDGDDFAVTSLRLLPREIRAIAAWHGIGTSEVDGDHAWDYFVSQAYDFRPAVNRSPRRRVNRLLRNLGLRPLTW